MVVVATVGLTSSTTPDPEFPNVTISPFATMLPCTYKCPPMYPPPVTFSALAPSTGVAKSTLSLLVIFSVVMIALRVSIVPNIFSEPLSGFITDDIIYILRLCIIYILIYAFKYLSILGLTSKMLYCILVK